MKPRFTKYTYYVREDGRGRKVNVKIFADSKGKINSLQRKTDLSRQNVHKEVFDVSDGERFQRALREELEHLKGQSSKQGNLIESLAYQIVQEEAKTEERLGYTARVIALAYARASNTSK